MRLPFLGHAAVRLEIGDHDVLIDPFLSGNPQAHTDAHCRVLAPGDALDV